LLWSRFGGLLRRGGRLGEGDRYTGRGSDYGRAGTMHLRTPCRAFDIEMVGGFLQDVGRELWVVLLEQFVMRLVLMTGCWSRSSMIGIEI
jgi:hypothetical protein